MKKKNAKKFRLNYDRHRFGYLFRRVVRVPDNADDLIGRQRAFAFFYASLGYLIGITLNILTVIGPQSAFFVAINSIHAALILLLVILYVRRAISVYLAVVLLILSIQIEIPIEMIHMAHSEGIIMGVPGILGNTILLGMLLIFSIIAYIRYLPYVQTLITIVTLVVCSYITQSLHIEYLIPLLLLAFFTLSFMGDRLVRGVASLQRSKNTLAREQDRVFEYLNIDKEELFRLIKLTRRKHLSENQKSRLLDLLDEQTKASVLEVAADVVEQKSRNLAALDTGELGLTPYEKEVCLMILQGMTVTEIARKFGKNASAITTIRATIRGKLGLQKQENLYESLLKLVGADGQPAGL